MRRHVCWSGSEQHYYIPSYLPCHHPIRSLKHITTCYTAQPHSQHELCVSRPLCTLANFSSGELSTHFHSISCWCMMLTYAMANRGSLSSGSNRFSLPLRQHKYVCSFEWSSLQTARSLAVLNGAAYKIHTRGTSWGYRD